MRSPTRLPGTPCSQRRAMPADSGVKTGISTKSLRAPVEGSSVGS
jgi:hypothetical protein